jgi:DNA-binding NtrC family response regulator
MSARVLIIEDEAVVAIDLAEWLERAGFVVVGPAPTVARALALIAQPGCEAAVLDIRLRQETSEAVAEELRAKGIPFVVLTGFGSTQLPAVFKDAPMLSKPVLPEDVISALKGCLGECGRD